MMRSEFDIAEHNSRQGCRGGIVLDEQKVAAVVSPHGGDEEKRKQEGVTWKHEPVREGRVGLAAAAHEEGGREGS